MKRLLPFILSVLFLFSCKAQEISQSQSGTSSASSPTQIFTHPKLVVGIVVDQMRYDYITRFWKRYGNDGFKRLIKDGFLLKNSHFNYVPTYTAPGHTSIFTGSTPRFHGIVSNNWYDKTADDYIYCVSDDSVAPVGTDSDAGKMSPKNLLVTTITDQNRLATQFRGKTIGISLKDRAAILPAGRSANAAYWFHGTKEEGKFITSTYYREALPDWVKTFNSSGKANSYIKTWNTLYPIETYTESGSDLNNFEGHFKGKKEATFPYDLKKISQEHYGFEILKRTPFGNGLTTDFAIAALKGEQLGQDDDTDFLTVSYSSPDYIGHRFGVNAKETEDNYLRLDQDIARLLNALDKQVGKGNYTVFLTADHGSVQVPSYLQSKKIAAHYFSTSALRKKLKAFVKEKYGSDELIANISNRQVFFNYKALGQNEIKPENFAKSIQQFLQNYPKIAQVYTRAMIEGGAFTSNLIASKVKKGFNPKRSGDVVYIYEPATLSYPHTGSSHGSPYNYDTHVPVIFYGKGINQGQTYERTNITDIAPTIAALLGIQTPNAAIGRILSEVIKP